MAVLPVMLEMSQLPVLVIGGGPQAQWKVQTLLAADANVTVVSPDATPRLKAWANLGRLSWVRRGVVAEDVAQARVVFIATEDPDEARRSREWATSARVLTNVVDDPAHCEFYSASHFRRGDLLVAISTSGQAPALAQALRQHLEKMFGPQWASFLSEIATVRRQGRPPEDVKRLAGEIAARLTPSSARDLC